MAETKNYLNYDGTAELVAKLRAVVDGKQEDDTYVMKQVDSGGNLLVGVKSNGEVETPVGIPDETAAVIEALAGKVAEIAEYLKAIQE